MMISAHTSSTVKLQQQSQHTKRAVVCRPRHRSSSLRVSAAAAAAPPAAAAPAADAVAQVVADEAQFVLQTYARPADVVFVRGEGSKLYDLHGKEYLDLAAGVCVCVCVVVGVWTCGRVLLDGSQSFRRALHAQASRSGSLCVRQPPL